MTGSLSALLVLTGLGISLASAFGAVVPSESVIQLGTWFLAAICGGQAAFSVWAREHSQTQELQEIIRPKIKCSFDAEISGCISNTNLYVGHAPGQKGIPTTYYRVKVEADSVGYVNDCRARLLTITQNGSIILSGEVIQLPFAPSHSVDAINKRLDDGVPQFVDVLAEFNKQMVIATQNFEYPASINMESLFSQSGNYVIEVVVSAPITKSQRIYLNMKRDSEGNVTVSCPSVSEQA